MMAGLASLKETICHTSQHIQFANIIENFNVESLLHLLLIDLFKILNIYLFKCAKNVLTVLANRICKISKKSYNGMVF